MRQHLSNIRDLMKCIKRTYDYAWTVIHRTREGSDLLIGGCEYRLPCGRRVVPFTGLPRLRISAVRVKIAHEHRSNPGILCHLSMSRSLVLSRLKTLSCSVFCSFRATTLALGPLLHDRFRGAAPCPDNTIGDKESGVEHDTSLFISSQSRFKVMTESS